MGTLGCSASAPISCTSAEPTCAANGVARLARSKPRAELVSPRRDDTAEPIDHLQRRLLSMRILCLCPVYHHGHGGVARAGSSRCCARTSPPLCGPRLSFIALGPLIFRCAPFPPVRLVLFAPLARAHRLDAQDLRRRDARVSRNIWRSVPCGRGRGPRGAGGTVQEKKQKPHDATSQSGTRHTASDAAASALPSRRAATMIATTATKSSVHACRPAACGESALCGSSSSSVAPLSPAAPPPCAAVSHARWRPAEGARSAAAVWGHLPRRRRRPQRRAGGGGGGRLARRGRRARPRAEAGRAPRRRRAARQPSCPRPP